MARASLPDRRDLAGFLSDLFGVDVAVAPTDAYQLKPRVHHTLAWYEDNHGAVVAAALFDVPMACRGGAALCMMPAEVANDSAEAGELPEALAENWVEVLNVLANLFSGRARVRLQDWTPPSARVPISVKKLARAAAGRRIDAAVDIPGYGAGRLTLLAA